MATSVPDKRKIKEAQDLIKKQMQAFEENFKKLDEKYASAKKAVEGHKKETSKIAGLGKQIDPED